LTQRLDPEILERLHIDLDVNRCVNCGIAPAGQDALFCSETCRQEARFVRYVRATLADGRAIQPDVQEAIGTKLIFALSGGYPARERYIPPTVRAQVWERDGRRCILCGEPASEIDHIQGNAHTLDNLRCVCHRCNLQRMEAGVTKLTDSDEIAGYQKLYDELVTRCQASQPTRLCDNEAQWNNEWRSLQKQRRAAQN
jgi:hypothetical protein